MRRESKKRNERITNLTEILEKDYACNYNYLQRVTGYNKSTLSRLLDIMREDMKIICRQESDYFHFYFLKSSDPDKVKTRIQFVKNGHKIERKSGYRQIRGNFLEDICVSVAEIEGYEAKARFRDLCFNEKGDLQEIRLDFIVDKSMLNQPFTDFKILREGIYLVGEVKNKFHPLFISDIKQHQKKIKFLELNHPSSRFIPCYVASFFHNTSREECESKDYLFFETPAIYLPALPEEIYEFYKLYTEKLKFEFPPLVTIKLPLTSKDQKFSAFRRGFNDKILY